MPNLFIWQERYNRLFEAKVAGKRLTDSAIAKRLGVSTTYVAEKRRAIGIGPTIVFREWEAWEKNLFAFGLSDSEIMERTGRTFSAVATARVKWGNGTRSTPSAGPVGLPEFRNPSLQRFRQTYGINVYATSETELFKRGLSDLTIHKITNRPVGGINAKRRELKQRGALCVS